MRDDYAVFIITHGRPYAQLTYNALKESGYTGKVYLVVDNLDKTLETYKERFPKNVVVFDKMEYVQRTDTGLSSPMINFAVFARNAVEQIAVDMGYKCFIMLDDDIKKFRCRFIKGDKLVSVPINGCMNEVLDSIVEYSLTGIACLGFGTIGTFIGGASTVVGVNDRGRIVIQGFIRNTSYKVDWKLNMLEDVITSFESGIAGQVWFVLRNIQMDIMPTGIGKGGNTEVYKSFDEFKQKFFPVIIRPSTYDGQFSDRVASGPRVKHGNSVPKIISGSYKKEKQ